MSSVSLIRIEGNKFKEAILNSLQLIDFDFPANVRNVVIKPNLCYYWDYSTGHTTDPRFVGSLIELLREQISSEVNISVIESDASAMKCKYAFKMLGYERLAKEFNVSLVNLSEEPSEKVTVNSGDRSLSFLVPQVIKNADLKISVPKIKYSLRSIKITCALKNIFGCNAYSKKFAYHSRLEEAIVAINKILKFNLSIVDGNIVSGVQPRKLGLVMSSIDPVALDSVAALIAGINPRSIKYLQLASREGLGKTTFTTKGVEWKYFRARYPTRRITSRLTNVAFDIAVRMHLESRLGLD